MLDFTIFKLNRKKEKLPSEKRLLIEEITSKTEKNNLNNITRTMAYLHFYHRHPEIHWAFLAHMVSRNAGWNMTDLKGDLLPRLLTEEEQRNFFSFLERANWLIFQDAFPQLLLYEESKQRGENLFGLLPYFDVSKFMKQAWNQFWKKQNSTELTISLIINEQHYIEDRVMNNNHFQKTVLDTLEFKIQELLEMNHILFPYLSKLNRVKFTGKTMHHFTSLGERINVGKILYSSIFKNEKVLEEMKSWALQHPHTGSRKDYWLHFFNDIQEEWPSKPFVIKAKSCQLIYDNNRFYSPKLEDVWDYVNHPPPDKKEWYSNYTSIKKYFISESVASQEPILDSYCMSLDLLQIAALAKKILLPWTNPK